MSQREYGDPHSRVIYNREKGKTFGIQTDPKGKGGLSVFRVYLINFVLVYVISK